MGLHGRGQELKGRARNPLFRLPMIGGRTVLERALAKLRISNVFLILKGTNSKQRSHLKKIKRATWIGFKNSGGSSGG